MYRNAYEVYQEAPVADAPAAASPKRRASSPTSRLVLPCRPRRSPQFHLSACAQESLLLSVADMAFMSFNLEDSLPGNLAAFPAGRLHQLHILLSRRNAESEQPSPSNSRGATLNSTAQRYAAYRLRAAQGEDSWHSSKAFAGQRQV